MTAMARPASKEPIWSHPGDRPRDRCAPRAGHEPSRRQCGRGCAPCWSCCRRRLPRSTRRRHDRSFRGRSPEECGDHASAPAGSRSSRSLCPAAAVLMGGSGSNLVGYQCGGTFALDRHRYSEAIPGTSFHRPGAALRVVTVPRGSGARLDGRAPWRQAVLQQECSSFRRSCLSSGPVFWQASVLKRRRIGTSAQSIR